MEEKKRKLSVESRDSKSSFYSIVSSINSLLYFLLLFFLLAFFYYYLGPLIEHSIINNGKDRYPIVIVPGFGGSQAHGLSANSTTPFSIWINLYYFLDPAYLDYYFSLVFDPKTNTTHDKQFAKVFFPGWGSTETLENLDTSSHDRTKYFSPLVDSLIMDKYFVRNKTMRGAPYDWRKATYENQKLYSDLKLLIEETSHAANKRVVLLGHSMGVLNSMKFLETVTDQWKRRYIAKFIATSGPYGGAAKTLKIEASGDNLGDSLVSPFKFRPIQRSLPSTAFLLPNPDIFPPDIPLIITPQRNYTSVDYEQFFKDIKYENAYKFYKLATNHFDGLQVPTGIDEFICVYGTNLPTIEQAIYAPPSFIYGKFPDQNPTIFYGDGDGTVNLKSLQACRKWPNAKVIELPGAEHLAIIGDQRYVEIVSDLVDSTSPALSVKRHFLFLYNRLVSKAKGLIPKF